MHSYSKLSLVPARRVLASSYSCPSRIRHFRGLSVVRSGRAVSSNGLDRGRGRVVAAAAAGVVPVPSAVDDDSAGRGTGGGGSQRRGVVVALSAAGAVGGPEVGICNKMFSTLLIT